MDSIALLAAAAPLGELLRAMALSAVGAIIGGRLGWLWYQRERRAQRRRAG